MASDQKLFSELVPDKIPDPADYSIPQSNIPGELMLVIIYAGGMMGDVHADDNYLYEYVSEESGDSYWKLKNRWTLLQPKWTNPRGTQKTTMTFLEQ